MKKKILIQSADDKSQKWSEAFKKSDFELTPLHGSPVWSPIFLLKEAILKGGVVGYVFRYLNDYKSLLKTLTRFMAELLTIALCLLLKIKIFWICHNVDKESIKFFPDISRLRRSILAKVAQRIFVTDKLLVPHANFQFPHYKNKIFAVSFGVVHKNVQILSNEERTAIEFIKKIKESQKDVMVFLCTGTPESEKSKHFDFLCSLIANSSATRLIAIVSGHFKGTKRGEDLFNQYKICPNILVYENYTVFSCEFILKYVDFYFRGYDDFSVPYSAYEAITFKKPLLALNMGFLPEFIEKYNLGCTLKSDFSNINDCLARLKKFNSSSCENFEVSHNWNSLMLALVECFKQAEMV